MYKNNEYFLEKMLEDVQFILDHMQDVSKEQLEANPVLEDSMMFRLIQISESAAKIEDEFKEKHEEFQWGDISGLRNRIVHDYGNVNMQVIYDTLTKDIAELKDQLEEILK